MKRMNFVVACLRPSQNVKLGIFTGSVQFDLSAMSEPGSIPPGLILNLQSTTTQSTVMTGMMLKEVE